MKTGQGEELLVLWLLVLLLLVLWFVSPELLASGLSVIFLRNVRLHGLRGPGSEQLRLPL